MWVPLLFISCSSGGLFVAVAIKVVDDSCRLVTVEVVLGCVVFDWFD